MERTRALLESLADALQNPDAPVDAQAVAFAHGMALFPLASEANRKEVFFCEPVLCIDISPIVCGNIILYITQAGEGRRGAAPAQECNQH